MDEEHLKHEPGEFGSAQPHPTTDEPYEERQEDEDRGDLLAPRREGKRLSRRRFLQMAAWATIGAVGAQMGLFRPASANNLLPPPTLGSATE
jgi:hypothetical protein